MIFNYWMQPSDFQGPWLTARNLQCPEGVLRGNDPKMPEKDCRISMRTGAFPSRKWQTLGVSWGYVTFHWPSRGYQGISLVLWIENSNRSPSEDYSHLSDPQVWIHGAIQIFFSLGIGHLAAQFWAPDPGPWDMLRVVLKLVAVWRFWGCNAILGGRQIWFIQVLLKIGGSGNCKQGDISNVRRKGSIKGCFWGAWDSVVVVMLWSYDLMLHSWLVFLENFWC